MQQAQLGYREEANQSSVTGTEEVAAFLLHKAQVWQAPAWVASVYLILPLHTWVQCLLNVPLRLIVVWFEFLTPLCHPFWLQRCSKDSIIRDPEQGLTRTISSLVTWHMSSHPAPSSYRLSVTTPHSRAH